jgi:hypothetical protein
MASGIRLRWSRRRARRSVAKTVGGQITCGHWRGFRLLNNAVDLFDIQTWSVEEAPTTAPATRALRGWGSGWKL